MSKFSFEVFGESHCDRIGIVINGIPKGTAIDEQSIAKMLERRRPKSSFESARVETDAFYFEKGVFKGIANGEQIIAVIENNQYKSNDYENISNTPRPSHADYPYCIKNNTNRIPSGGGKYSARMTAPLCIVGAIAKDILLKNGIKICGYIRAIGGIEGDNYDNATLTADSIESVMKNAIPALSNQQKMQERINVAAKAKDSVGGVVDCVVFGMPIGVGNCLFEGLEGNIAFMLFGIPAVKGVEFGKGFSLSSLLGSEANDCYCYNNGNVELLSNNNGGIVGGMSNGGQITLSVAFKPTPSIGLAQPSVDLASKQNVSLTINGRHDACFVPRAVCLVECMVATALVKYFL